MSHNYLFASQILTRNDLKLSVDFFATLLNLNASPLFAVSVWAKKIFIWKTCISYAPMFYRKRKLTFIFNSVNSLKFLQFNPRKTLFEVPSINIFKYSYILVNVKFIRFQPTDRRTKLITLGNFNFQFLFCWLSISITVNSLMAKWISFEITIVLSVILFNKFELKIDKTYLNVLAYINL